MSNQRWRPVEIDALIESIGDRLPEAELYCVGAGIRGATELTLDALLAIRRSHHAFAFPDVTWLPAITQSLGVALERLDYPPVQRRADIMSSAAIRIASSAVEDPPVSFLTAGSPVRHVWLTSLLREWATREGVSVHVVHGVSSLDHLCADIAIDDSRGLQLFDSTFFLALRQQPNISSHCFIFNLENTLMQRSAVHTQPLSSMMAQLQNHLLDFYPTDHVVTFALVGSEHVPQLRSEVALEDLHRNAPPRPMGSLYVPPVTPMVELKPLRVHELANLVKLVRSPADQVLGAAAAEWLDRIVQSRV